ncbi:MAG: hypothetical protein NVSMB9_13740 [Isosphaeraceae bacterium]
MLSNRESRPDQTRPFAPERALRWVAEGVRLGLTLAEKHFHPYWFLVRFLDRRDERQACSHREEFGGRRWVLSWHRRSDGLWTARLSGPEVVRTLERTARTRRKAIARAARAMSSLSARRSLLDPRAPRDVLSKEPP